MADNLISDIFSEYYADDLRKTIKNGESLDAFIQELDAREKQDFLQNDKQLNAWRKGIASYETDIAKEDAKIQSGQTNKALLYDIQEKVDDLIASYPPYRQKELKAYLESIAERGEFSDFSSRKYDELTAPPNGFIRKIRDNNQINQANQKLEEFLTFCQDKNLNETLKDQDIGSAVSKAVKGEEISSVVQSLDAKINESLQTKANYAGKISQLNSNIETSINSYDTNEDVIYRKTQRDKNISQFVEQYKETVLNPTSISQEEILDKGLSKEFIDGQVLQSKCPNAVRASIRRFYEDLDRPAAPMVAFDGAYSDAILDNLKKQGLDAVSSTDPRAKDPNVFVVDKNCIHAPFMSPDEALKANIKMIEAMNDVGARPHLSNPLTREALVPAVDKDLGYNLAKDIYDNKNVDNVLSHFPNNEYVHLNDCLKYVQKEDAQLYTQILTEINNKYQDLAQTQSWNLENANNLAKDVFEKHSSELTPYQNQVFVDTMCKEAYANGIDPSILDENVKTAAQTGKLNSVFHAGASSDPYAVLCREDNMNFIYGAAGVTGMADIEVNGRSQTPDGCLGYAFGKSSHNKKSLSSGSTQFGFLFEYESSGAKQEFIGIDRSGIDIKIDDFNAERLEGSYDETAVLPHQNKLKKIYVATQDAKGERVLFPIEVNENGTAKDKRWQTFLDLHKPIDDNPKGYMVERRNNLIKDYDSQGKEKMMLRKANIVDKSATPPKMAENTATINSVDAAKQTTEKVASVATKDAAIIAWEKSGRSSAGVVKKISSADNAVNKTISATMEKGNKLLNNNAVGKVLVKAEDKVGEKMAQGVATVAKGINKITPKVVKNVANKTVANTSMKAVGKSVLKKIPVVSAVAGACFAYGRLKEGDWKGACGELASGVAGCFPGVGTAASLAIDSGLIGRDIYNETQKSKTVLANNVDNKAKNVPNIDPKTKQLINQQRGLGPKEAKPRTINSNQTINNMAMMYNKKNEYGK